MNFNSEKFNYNFNILSKVIFVILLIIMIVTSGFLYFEYSFFKKQSSNMLELQEDYKTYIGAVNKILVDYNRVKEELENRVGNFEAKPDQKKKDERLILKNSRFSDIYFFDNFSKNAKIFSSEDDSGESFCVVNRDLKHLRLSYFRFIKNYYNSWRNGAGINASDLFDYTEYSLAKIAEANRIIQQAKAARLRANRIKKYRKFRRTNRAKKISSYPRENRLSNYNNEKDNLPGISLSWPVEKSKFYFSSFYGPRRKCSGAWGFHYGVDMAACRGTPVRAAHSGIVVEARHRHDYGNTIVIAHDRKYKTRYAHLQKIFVSVGQKVSVLEKIGAVGATGYVRSSRGGDGSHLHFEVIESGRKINPLPFIA